MTYLLKFKLIKIAADGSRSDFLRNESTVNFTSRKAIFEYIEKIDEMQNKRWNYSLRNDNSKVEVDKETIKILEPEYEMVNIRGKICKRKKGMKTYTKKAYSMTFCKICGRVLTDPVSVSRGIGPECWSKIH